jgi:hypothetical protein
MSFQPRAGICEGVVAERPRPSSAAAFPPPGCSGVSRGGAGDAPAAGPRAQLVHVFPKPGARLFGFPFELLAAIRHGSSLAKMGQKGELRSLALGSAGGPGGNLRRAMQFRDAASMRERPRRYFPRAASAASS